MLLNQSMLRRDYLRRILKIKQVYGDWYSTAMIHASFVYFSHEKSNPLKKLIFFSVL